jgi:hypothetical protein
MTPEEFRASVGGSVPPDVPPLLIALWHDARGDWPAAHAIAQDVDSAEGAWVHAYLHRKEGDLANARYWYRRASREEATGTLDDEWTNLVRSLL